MYRRNFNSRDTEQTQPIPGKEQVQNSAGGYVFEVDDWTRLDRFLVLGTEGGTYYVSEKDHTYGNGEAVRKVVASDGLRVVNRIVEISEAGRAPKNDPALFALAIAASFGDDSTRRAALDALPRVARIGTHLFHFAEYVEGFRGWGRGLRKAVSNWYTSKTPDSFAFDAVKYPQRDGWSHRDLLRLSHPNFEDADATQVARFITGKDMDAPYPRVIEGFQRVAVETDPKKVAQLVTEYNLPAEAVPSEKRAQEVLEALLPNLGITALIRSLGSYTANGVFGAGQSAANGLAVERITDVDRLVRGRVHPIQILAALTTYAQGHGARGKLSWTPVPNIVDALDEAFYLAFKAVEPTGKRFVLGLDVSGSMGWEGIQNIPGLSPRVASAALSMVTYQTERNVTPMAFGNEFHSLDNIFSRRRRLDDITKGVDNLPFGRTDCALPMVWALNTKVEADVFIVYTDNETFAGRPHPVQALNQYRDKMGIDAKLIVVGMTATGFSIADPNDAGMLDVVGFDTAVPTLISDFVK